nr:hypothetical protein LBZUJACN_LBZUJACN_CDS_0014 [Caudoviricetes sp.]CAI9750972.1 hypothetical protein MIHLRAQX_MIHLRAQX_CDS_0014 [Caudoviricetes sp.]
MLLCILYILVHKLTTTNVFLHKKRPSFGQFCRAGQLLYKITTL